MTPTSPQTELQTDSLNFADRLEISFGEIGGQLRENGVPPVAIALNASGVSLDSFLRYEVARLSRSPLGQSPSIVVLVGEPFLKVTVTDTG